MSKLTNYIDTITELAMQQGLSAVNDILYRVSPDVLIIMSFDEPTDHLFPLNGLWVISDSASADYKKVLRRSSKTATAPYTYTWQEVTEYDDVMNTVQQWDASDLPQPVIVSGKGGQLEGKLLPRVTSAYDLTEAIPRQYVDTVRTNINNSFFTMFSNMNNRVNQNLLSIRGLQDTTAQHGVRLDALEVSKNSVTAKVFKQDIEDTVWTLRHDLGQGTGFVNILDPNGEIICPDSINPLEGDEANVLQVIFSAPVSGLAILMYVPLQGEV